MVVARQEWPDPEPPARTSASFPAPGSGRARYGGRRGPFATARKISTVSETFNFGARQFRPALNLTVRGHAFSSRLRCSLPGQTPCETDKNCTYDRKGETERKKLKVIRWLLFPKWNYRWFLARVPKVNRVRIIPSM